MSGIFGLLGYNDSDRVYLSTVGQSVVYDAANELLARHNAELDSALGVFVDETTDDHKRRYKLPGGGRLQRVGPQSAAAVTKATGAWDVAFRLEEFAAGWGSDRVEFAYMTLQDLDRHLSTIMQQNVNTVRFELLKALMNNTQDTFVDPMWGSLSIEPLANGDSVVYPPVLGSESEAAEDHYLESGYAAASISDANDPIVTIVDDLEHHFGAATGGSNIVIFVNNAQRSQIGGLTDFDPVVDRFISPGTQTATPDGLPGNVPGRTLGRHNAGAWIVEWRWIPANYCVGVHLDAPGPLIKRTDPAYTGLPAGLALVKEDDVHPFTNSHYSHRFGFGAGNRLNGVVVELGTGGTYSIPSAYS
jgi:hypothetical protein